jgi:hypothetical protein
LLLVRLLLLMICQAAINFGQRYDIACMCWERLYVRWAEANVISVPLLHHVVCALYVRHFIACMCLYVICFVFVLFLAVRLYCIYSSYSGLFVLILHS